MDSQNKFVYATDTLSDQSCSPIIEKVNKIK